MKYLKILFLVVLITALGSVIRPVQAQDIFEPSQNLNDLANHGFLMFIVFGFLIMILGYGFALFPPRVLKRLILPSYGLMIFVYLFVLVSKSGFLHGDIAAGIPPFYARWGYIHLLYNNKIFFILFLVLVLFVLSYLVLRKVKSTFPFLLSLILLSLLLAIMISAITMSFAMQEYDFWENIRRSVIGRFKLTDLEYVGDIDKVEAGFLAKYSQLLPVESSAKHYFSSHSSTHPPGAILLYYFASKISNNLFFLGLFNILLGTLALVPTYLVTNQLYGREAARKAAWIYMLVPGIVLYAATCFDATLPFFFGFLVYFFLKALEKRAWLYIPLFGLFAVLNLLLSFTIGLTLPFFIIFFLLVAKKIKYPVWKAVGLLCAPLLFQFLLYIWTSYSPWTVFTVARQNQQLFMADFPRPYSYFVFGDLVDFFFFLGIPLTVLIGLNLIQVIKKIKKHETLILDALFIAFLLTLLIYNLTGLVRGEAARVWLFLIPLAVASLVPFSLNYFKQAPNKLMLLLGVALLIQTIIVEIYFDTYW